MSEPDTAAPAPQPAPTKVLAAVQNTVTAGFVAGTAGGSVDIVEGILLDIAKWSHFTFEHPGAWAGGIVGLAGWIMHNLSKKESAK